LSNTSRCSLSFEPTRGVTLDELSRGLKEDNMARMIIADGGTKKMGTLNRIELDPKVCNGKPVIRGTRIAVFVVLERLAAQESWQTILSAYPELKEEDIQEAILYARALLDHTEFRVVNA
jgi:uncharacterized protein (DUF433 family)